MKITFDFLEENGYPSVTDYCRALMKEGTTESTIEVYRGEMLCLTVDIARAAKLEPNGTCFVKYTEGNGLKGRRKARQASLMR